MQFRKTEIWHGPIQPIVFLGSLPKNLMHPVVLSSTKPCASLCLSLLEFQNNKTEAMKGFDRAAARVSRIPRIANSVGTQKQSVKLLQVYEKTNWNFPKGAAPPSSLQLDGLRLKKSLHLKCCTPAMTGGRTARIHTGVKIKILESS